MSFEDLPPHWEQHPLTSPELCSDVLDLFCKTTIRRSRCLFLLVTDRNQRLLMPMLVDELGHCREGEHDLVLGNVLAVAMPFGCGGLAVGLCQPDGVDLAEAFEWAEALRRQADGHQVRDLGLHVVTEDEVVWLDELLAGIGA